MITIEKNCVSVYFYGHNVLKLLLNDTFFKKIFFIDYCNSFSQRFNISSLPFQVVLSERKSFNYSNNASLLAAELDRVKTSRKMKEFLSNYVDWDVRLHPTDDFDIFDLEKNSNYSYSSFYCMVYDPDYDNLIYILQTHYEIFIVLGLISLFGNGFAITHHAKNFFKPKQSKPKESKVYDMLIFNLCFADLLNAVYLMVYPTAIAKLNIISKSLCNTLGVISVLSIQSSVSFLVIITAYRVYGVLYPYKSIRIKSVVALLVLVWFVWLIVVLIPLFNVSLFAHAFTFGIEIVDTRCYVPLEEIAYFVDLFTESLNGTQDLFGLVLNNLKNYTSINEVRVQISKSFNLIDHDNTRFYDYYGPNRGCSIETFTSNTNAKTHFSLSLFTFNLVAFLFIIIAHIVIFKQISSFSFKNLLPIALQKNKLMQREKKTQKIKTENKHIYLRIFVVVLTDLICGIPVCLIGIVYYVGQVINDCFYFEQGPFAESIAPFLSLMLFPLNSVINPYIYSFHLWQDFFKSCRQQISDITSTLSSSAESN